MFIFDSIEKRNEVRDFYIEHIEGLASLAKVAGKLDDPPWVFTQGHLLVEINGALPEETAMEYRAALALALDVEPATIAQVERIEVTPAPLLADVAYPTHTPVPLPSDSQGGYRIVKQEDMSLSGVKRIQYRIVVDKPPNEVQLRQICEEIIETAKTQTPHNAISFLFYQNGTDTRGTYTAGKATWAPNGKWEDAGQVTTGDYSRHKLVIVSGSAVSSTPKSSDAGLSEKTRREVFYKLVEAQDQGVGDERAYEIVAKRYGLTLAVVKQIAIEGVTKGWPMP